MAHVYTTHCDRLNALCRICGDRVVRISKDKGRSVKLCEEYADLIKEFHDVHVQQDQEGKHPKGICTKCSACSLLCPCIECFIPLMPLHTP